MSIIENMRVSVLLIELICLEGIIFLPLVSNCVPIHSIKQGILLETMFILSQFLLPLILFFFEQKHKFILPEKRWIQVTNFIGLTFCYCFLILVQITILAALGEPWAKHALSNLFDVFVL
jgi:hypothetical protein